ncbi:MAG: thioredoxin domain-containing protein [Actinomycetota bacterium]|nr:thioredoxin domain-containing protein [Actinomycetota bacterium]
MLETSDAAFERDVLLADLPVLVDFWAPGCHPCRAVAPILDELAKRHGDRMRVARVNVDENPELAARYAVLTLPTVILFAGGRVEEVIIGARSRSHFQRTLARWVSVTPA